MAGVVGWVGFSAGVLILVRTWTSVIGDTTGPMDTAVLTIMAAFGELERDTMIERARGRTRRGRGKQPPRRKAPQSGSCCHC